MCQRLKGQILPVVMACLLAHDDAHGVIVTAVGHDYAERSARQ